jgi:hypothetical protein
MSTLRLARDAVRLTGRERELAARALVWLVVARVGLRVASFPRVLRVLRRVPARHLRSAGATETECRRAIERAARVLPASTCLARAFAGAALLRREGRPSQLNIHVGHVGLDEQRRFAAHASLVAADVVVAGAGPELQWTVLLSDRFELPEP